MATISEFIDRHYRHFNALSLRQAAASYRTLIEDGGKMFLSMAGAMSSAELGISLAEMIRQDKIHAICCTGANLEEDVYNLIAHDHYESIPHYRDLSPKDEEALLERDLCRVTDTLIPEEQAMFVLRDVMLEQWQASANEGRRLFPYQHLYEVLRAGKLEGSYQIDPKDSWLLAAAEKDLPMFVPGWEDCTLGNMFTAFAIRKKVDSQTMRSGIETMMFLADWYESTTKESPVGFFQIGGGIAGDFPICVVPMLRVDLDRKVPHWAYFAQISDSTTSYGSYSGAVPNEKISWDKLNVDTPKFVIESDATIVAPLIFYYVLGL